MAGMNLKPKALASKPVPVNDEAEEEARFERAISGGSDYKGLAPEPVKAKRKRKKPTTLTVDEDMLQALDDLARSRGMSRAAVMILAFSEHLARSKV